MEQPIWQGIRRLAYFSIIWGEEGMGGGGGGGSKKDNMRWFYKERSMRSEIFNFSSKLNKCPKVLWPTLLLGL